MWQRCDRSWRSLRGRVRGRFGEDGSLGSLDDSDEAPAFGNADFSDEFGGQDLGESQEQGAPNASNSEARRGLLAGHWAQTRPNGGVFGGRWHSLTGEGAGHLAGRYGTTPAGRRLFHGKVINLEGRFLGILSGTWDDGAFRGGFYGADGLLRGVLRGQVSNQDGHGRFRGHWRAADEADGSPVVNLTADRVVLDDTLSISRLSATGTPIAVGTVADDIRDLGVMCTPIASVDDDVVAECYVEDGENSCSSNSFVATFSPGPVAPLQIAFDPIELWVLLGCPND